MPELPEVETTRMGLLPHVRGQRIVRVIVRDRRLRWPIPADFAARLQDTIVTDMTRRGKYLLWHCAAEPTKNSKLTINIAKSGFVLSHLGMSGTLRVLPVGTEAVKHDHVDIELDNKLMVRFNDPRRFGAMLWIPRDESGDSAAKATHPLLDILGPEPLSDAFSAQHLFEKSRGRTVSVKEFIMNGHIVVGVGNIYASESLFGAGIHPARSAGKISLARYQKLVAAIRSTLAEAIRAGGSTLRDYVKADGESGYFQLEAFTYGRAGEACRTCETPIRQIVQSNRSTYFCPRCQR